MNPKGKIDFLIGLICCCVYGYMDHIHSGIHNNLLSVDRSVRDFFLYLNHWTLLVSLILLAIYFLSNNQNQG